MRYMSRQWSVFDPKRRWKCVDMYLSYSDTFNVIKFFMLYLLSF